MSKLKSFALFLALMLTAACYARVSAGSGCDKPPQTDSKDVVVVSGILQKEEHWGPPNFGENPATDSKIKILVLTLDHPLQVLEDKEFGSGKRTSVAKLQLHVSSERIAFASSQERKRVKVSGSLSIAVGPAEMTAVTMNVSELIVVAGPVGTECRYAQ